MDEYSTNANSLIYNAMLNGPRNEKDNLSWKELYNDNYKLIVKDLNKISKTAKRIDKIAKEFVKTIDPKYMEGLKEQMIFYTELNVKFSLGIRKFEEIYKLDKFDRDTVEKFLYGSQSMVDKAFASFLNPHGWKK